MNFLPPWARTLFSLIFIASIVTFSLYVSLYTSLLPENINQSLINGVATSIIGSFVFLGLLFILKPNLKISPNIAHYESIEGDKAGGQDAFVFKISSVQLKVQEPQLVTETGVKLRECFIRK